MAEFKKHSRRVSRTDHSHREGEAPMRLDALRAHLSREHGWTPGMFTTGRCDGPEGEVYMRSWHKGDHVPLADPPQ